VTARRGLEPRAGGRKIPAMPTPRARPALLGAAMAALLLVPALVAQPTAPGTFDVRSFGARGDGAANDTAAINRAIDAAQGGGGGTVEFSAGDYVSGSIRMRSNVALHLGPGATIIASSQEQDYDAPEANEWGDVQKYQDAGHSHWHNSLIWGENLEGVSITGPGRILGRGLNRGYYKPGSPDSLSQKVGNKAIALRNCRNVILRDFTIEHGGWFGILATGVDNLTIDGLRIDTNRDGMDIDCCHNVRISNCSVNSPWDDGICLKSSFGLGQFRSTEDVTVSDCLVSGYDEGTLLDGTRRHSADNPAPTGRIKFGTESNGGFRAVTVANCVFECCRGLALETVDGALLEDVTVSNLTMRRIFSAPLFLRLGARMRGPPGTPVGRLARVLISHVVAEGVEGGQGILVVGTAGHPVQDVTLDDILVEFAGGGTAEEAAREVPEMDREYPEAGSFGVTPSWGLYARHAANLVVHHVELRTLAADLRPSVYLEDVSGAEFERVRAVPAAGSKAFLLKNVGGFSAQSCPGVADTDRARVEGAERL
jgi:polygalacturonase